jgi:phospholipid/cholesterol/gamma-HCH transport system substrate-binding protein
MSSDGISNFNVNTYEVTLSDASGLSTRSKVYLAGVVVGKVRKIELTGNEARLQVSFLKDIEIRQNAMLSRRTNAVLGTSVLALDPGTELTPIIPPGGVIGTDQNSADMNALMGTVQDLSGQITEILGEFQKTHLALLAVSIETFNSLARKFDAQSDAQLENITRILESTALITGRAEAMFRNSESDISGSMNEIYVALANIRAITDELRQGRGNFGQALSDDRLYAGLLSTVEKTDEAAEKLKDALDSVNRLAQNVDNVVSSAGDIVDRAAGLGIQVDTGAYYELVSERVRAGASLRLEPRSNDRWYRIGVSSSPDGISKRTVTETIYDDGSGLPILRSEDVTETRYDFSVDAELARRFGILTIRGGLLESTAGFGFDVQPLSWLSLSGEVFNFRTGEAPNLRGALTIYPFFNPDSDKPWNWLYLRGGINNALNGSRDYFFGGGLRFADREVKGLIGLAPVFGGN